MGIWDGAIGRLNSQHSRLQCAGELPKKTNIDHRKESYRQYRGIFRHSFISVESISGKDSL